MSGAIVKRKWPLHIEPARASRSPAGVSVPPKKARRRKTNPFFHTDASKDQEPRRRGGFMSRLRMLQVWMATAVLSTGLAVLPDMAAGSSTQTFTGKVSDAMCGAKHTEAGIAPADCVRACVP